MFIEHPESIERIDNLPFFNLTVAHSFVFISPTLTTDNPRSPRMELRSIKGGRSVSAS